MKLLLDAGNNRIKWAVSGKNYWKSGASHRIDLAESLQSKLDKKVEIDRITVSSTRNQSYNQQLNTMVEELFNHTAHFIQPQRRHFDVLNRYDPVTSLGSDRWAGIVAARSMSNNAAIVIDCGTAVTVDAVNSDGLFEGGVIFPGVELALLALNNADNLNQAKHVDPSVFGLNTDQAMYSGVVYSIACGIDGIVQKMRKSLGISVNIYICGGDAPVISQMLDHHLIVEPDMVLKGLKVIAEDHR